MPVLRLEPEMHPDTAAKSQSCERTEWSRLKLGFQVPKLFHLMVCDVRRVDLGAFARKGVIPLALDHAERFVAVVLCLQKLSLRTDMNAVTTSSVTFALAYWCACTMSTRSSTSVVLTSLERSFPAL